MRSRRALAAIAPTLALVGLLACSGSTGAVGAEPGSSGGTGTGAGDGTASADGGTQPPGASLPDGGAIPPGSSLPDGGSDGASTVTPWTGSLALSGDSSCVVKNGKLVCWGRSLYGMFGPTAPLGDRTPPTEVSGIAPTSAALMRDHVCALAAGGAYCWGRNDVAQLGPTTPPCTADSCATPALLGVADVVESAGHTGTTCVRDRSLDVRCWGRSGEGEAGRTGSPSGVPTLVTGGALHVGMGYEFGCALRTDHKVSCWGSNARGTLGRDTSGGFWGGTDIAAHPSPVLVPGLAGVSQLAVGEHHVCVVASEVKCWGWNGSGPYATGQTGHDPALDADCKVGKCSITPTVVPGVGGVTKLALGGWHSCALRSDRTVVCWGANFNGALGHDPAGDAALAVPTPSPVVGLSDVVDLALGNAHACALTGAGEVYCWGSNAEGQLGQPAPMSESWVPQRVNGL